MTQGLCEAKKKIIISKMLEKVGERWSTFGEVLQNQSFRLLPSKYIAPEMTICTSFLVNRVLEVEAFGDCTRSQVEVLLDNLEQLSLAVFGCAIVENGDRKRFR